MRPKAVVLYLKDGTTKTLKINSHGWYVDEKEKLALDEVLDKYKPVDLRYIYKKEAR